MQTVTLISSYSNESAAVIKMLEESKIPYKESKETSYTAQPVLIDPKGRLPYRGLTEIKEFLEAFVLINKLLVNGKDQKLKEIV
jgi:hypothetical protein